MNVSGLGTATFADSIVIFSTLNDLSIFGVPAVVILDNTSGTGILLQTGSAFSSYDLRGPLGPLSFCHSPGLADKLLADRQAYWLEKVLAEEHERDQKHPDRIELPD